MVTRYARGSLNRDVERPVIDGHRAGAARDPGIGAN